MANNKCITVNGVNHYKSIFTSNYSPVYISDYMSGKMEGIPAISTSVFLNPYCAARAKDPNSICSHCYARATVERYKDLNRHIEENTSVLAELVPVELLPRFKKTVGIVRFEAFGDLFSETQAINYFRIAEANPHVKFALWTKNKGIARRAVEMYYKPDNLQLVYSANKINEPEPLPLYFDKVFTVWSDAETCAADGYGEINCGSRQCADCAVCYLEKYTALINELLK